MQRLTASAPARERDQRGASAVIIALLLVALMACGALAIDVSATYVRQQQLQNGADAAVLAVAQDCAKGACGLYQSTAQTYGSANVGNGAGSTTRVTTAGLSPTTGRVTVRSTANQQHWFGGVVGRGSTDLSAGATATWGAPSGGTAVIPLVFSWCEWNAQTGGAMPSGTTQRTIVLPKKSDTGCTGPNGLFVPGGFGWIKTDAGKGCQATTTIGQQAESDPGKSIPSACTQAYVSSLANKTVLLPIFVEYGGTGNNAWYKVKGYAAFRIVDYYFSNTYKLATSPNSSPPCGSPDQCLRGYYVRYVDLDDDWQTSATAPAYGANLITLTA